MEAETLQAYTADVLDLRQSAIKTVFNWVAENYSDDDQTIINEVSPTETVIECVLDNIELTMKKDTKYFPDGRFEVWGIHTPKLLDIAKEIIIGQYANKLLYPDFNKFLEVKGDLIDLAFEGHFDAILHLCNCKRNFGAGIAKQIRNRIPEAHRADLNHNKYSTQTIIPVNDGGRELQPNKPSDYSVAKLDNMSLNFKFDVINLYGQYHWGKPSFDNAYWEAGKTIRDTAQNRYEWIKKGLQNINQEYEGKIIGLPLIGCGYAGLEWDKIKKIIQETLVNCRVVIVHFDGKQLKKAHILHHSDGKYLRKSTIDLPIPEYRIQKNIAPTLTKNGYFFAYES